LMNISEGITPPLLIWLLLILIHFWCHDLCFVLLGLILFISILLEIFRSFLSEVPLWCNVLLPFYYFLSQRPVNQLPFASKFCNI
jgi:hypothetical protein